MGGGANPCRGEHPGGGGGCIEKGGGEGANISLQPPTPLAHPHSRANAHAKGRVLAAGGGGGWGGWFNVLALFTCCFALFLVVCVHFITVTKNKNKNKKKAEFQIKRAKPARSVETLRNGKNSQ